MKQQQQQLEQMLALMMSEFESQGRLMQSDLISCRYTNKWGETQHSLTHLTTHSFRFSERVFYFAFESGCNSPIDPLSLLLVCFFSFFFSFSSLCFFSLFPLFLLSSLQTGVSHFLPSSTIQLSHPGVHLHQRDTPITHVLSCALALGSTFCQPNLCKSSLSLLQLTHLPFDSSQERLLTRTRPGNFGYWAYFRFGNRFHLHYIHCISQTLGQVIQSGLLCHRTCHY